MPFLRPVSNCVSGTSVMLSQGQIQSVLAGPVSIVQKNAVLTDMYTCHGLGKGPGGEIRNPKAW